MKIVCKINKYYKTKITVGKSYDLLSPHYKRIKGHPPRTFKIINDNGDIDYYSEDFFESIQESRDRKISELLK